MIFVTTKIVFLGHISILQLNLAPIVFIGYVNCEFARIAPQTRLKGLKSKLWIWDLNMTLKRWGMWDLKINITCDTNQECEHCYLGIYGLKLVNMKSLSLNVDCEVIRLAAQVCLNKWTTNVEIVNSRNQMWNCQTEPPKLILAMIKY